MLIDWFTVVAQILNFLILIWLLKRFLYKPILHAIDEREKRVAQELADAETTKVEAQKAREIFRDKNEKFDRQRAALLREATEEAQTKRQQLLAEARQAAEELHAKQQEALIREARELHQAIGRRTQAEVFAITRKTLKDLASTSLEEQLVGVFIRRLGEMNDQAKKDFTKALQGAHDSVVMRSAFALPAEQQERLTKALNDFFPADVRIRFEITPELISGIELATNGHKLAWSISDYLLSLQNTVEELLDKKKHPDVTADSGDERVAVALQSL